MKNLKLLKKLDPISRYEINKGNNVTVSYIGETRLSDGIKVSSKYWECKYFFDENSKVSISSFNSIKKNKILPISLFSFIKNIKNGWNNLSIKFIEIIPLISDDKKQEKLIKILAKLGFFMTKNEDNLDCFIYDKQKVK